MACRKRRLNGAVLLDKTVLTEVPCHSRYGMNNELDPFMFKSRKRRVKARGLQPFVGKCDDFRSVKYSRTGAK